MSMPHPGLLAGWGAALHASRRGWTDWINMRHDIKDRVLADHISASRRDIMAFDQGKLIQDFEMNIHYDQIADLPRA